MDRLCPVRVTIWRRAVASKPRSEWSDTYRRRVERAEAAGKTRQQARGHVEREHVRRRQRAADPPISPIGGLTPSQKGQITRFNREQSERAYRTPAEAAASHYKMTKYATMQGYGRLAAVMKKQRQMLAAKTAAGGDWVRHKGLDQAWASEYEVDQEDLWWFWYG